MYKQNFDFIVDKAKTAKKPVRVVIAGADCENILKGAFRAQEAGFVDLQKIAYEWGIRDKSVKKLTAIIMGRKVSKAQQLSNWEAGELSRAQQLYAATDAWICLKMYKALLGA